MVRRAIYPGSFDPPTKGHINLVERGLTLFDHLVVAVAVNSSKKGLFTMEERVQMLKESLKHLPQDRIEVDQFDGLLVEYAKKKEAQAVLRGLRAISDFEYEFQMAMVNTHLARDIQSVFMMTDNQWLYISSSIVKEAASLGGDICAMVPKVVADRLKEKFSLT